MIMIYGCNKSFKKGYDIYKLEFLPLQFKNRKETFYKNVRTCKEAYEIIGKLNGCKD